MGVAVRTQRLRQKKAFRLLEGAQKVQTRPVATVFKWQFPHNREEQVPGIKEKQDRGV